MALAAPVAVQKTGAQEQPADPPIVLGPETNLPLPRFVSLRGGKVNVRRGPGLEYRIDWVFQRSGLPVRVIDRRHRARDRAGRAGGGGPSAAMPRGLVPGRGRGPRRLGAQERRLGRGCGRGVRRVRPRRQRGARERCSRVNTMLCD